MDDKQTSKMVFLICLVVAAIVLIGHGCGNTEYNVSGVEDSDITFGSQSPIEAECCDGDDGGWGDGNLCSVPSGTDVPDETCLQNGGFRECQPCVEMGG